jgi:hypothetical protein
VPDSTATGGGKVVVVVVEVLVDDDVLGAEVPRLFAKSRLSESLHPLSARVATSESAKILILSTKSSKS